MRPFGHARSMKADVCPDRSLLSSHLLGKVQGEAAEAIDRHLAECEACLNVAREVNAEDVFTSVMRSGKPSPVVKDAELAAALERAKRLLARRDGAYSHETLGSQSTTDGDEPPKSADDEEDVSFLAPPELPDEIGRLGGYRVLQVLGVGGMGIVFRAEDPGLQRLIALKAMRPALAARKSARDRFLQEAKATAAIEHDHIVTIHQVGEDRKTPFLAMQFLRGESLQRRLQREGKITEHEIVRIGREVAAGLDAAHRRGLIHRDIKPDNIWLEETGRVKILDFGLVRAASGDSGLTQSGVVLGTPRYMAPEQAKGEAIDSRCDLFSLGAVLYHLAAGRAPFDGENVTAALLAVVHSAPAPLETSCSGIHPELSRLIEQLLSKNREQRPGSAAEVARRLEEIASRSGVSHPRQVRSASHAAEGRGVAARRTWLVSGIAVVLALLTVLGIRTARDDDTKERIGRSTAPKAAEVAGSPAEKNSDDDAPSPDREAAQWVLDLGGVIAIDTSSETGVFLRRPDPLPEGPFQITWIDLSRIQELTNDELRRVAGLASVSQINLSYTGIGDRGLANLTDLPRMVYLNLVNTQVTDAGMAPLCELPLLRQLHLSRCNISDKAIPHLRRMKLMELTLDGTDVTYEGLSQLPADSTLRAINVMQLGLTADEVGDLSELLPNCRLHTDYGVVGPKSSRK
jgi:serine/threonine protein kinase